jgi:hypothetical protein
MSEGGYDSGSYLPPQVSGGPAQIEARPNRSVHPTWQGPRRRLVVRRTLVDMRWRESQGSQDVTGSGLERLDFFQQIVELAIP